MLSKLKFSLGHTPLVDEFEGNIRRFVPAPFKAVCLISADFELAWASRYSKKADNPLKKSIKDGIQTRVNIPKILDLCDKHGIPITWATVGHLFLEKCEPIDGVKHPDITRLPYFENDFWRFNHGDWFDFDPCTSYQQDPAWYAPDLIRDILSRKVKHEVGCHTFSHIDCRDTIDDGVVFESELKKCIDVAKEWGINLRSFVHPGHTIGHLDILQQKGFSSFRTDMQDTLSYPKKHIDGLWELKNSAELGWRNGWSAAYHIKRFKVIIDRAIKHNRLCVLWFHPSFADQLPDIVFPQLFQYLQTKKDEIICLTHTEYVEYLENNYLRSSKC